MPFGIFVSLKHMSDVESLRLVVFRVGELICAVPAAIVREVIPQQPATRIPGASAEVDGLFNVRGTLLTVFDGRRMLERQGSADQDGSVLVLETNGRTVGIGVDEVLDLVEVPLSSLDSTRGSPWSGSAPGSSGGPGWPAGLRGARHRCTAHTASDLTIISSTAQTPLATGGSREPYGAGLR